MQYIGHRRWIHIDWRDLHTQRPSARRRSWSRRRRTDNCLFLKRLISQLDEISRSIDNFNWEANQGLIWESNGIFPLRLTVPRDELESVIADLSFYMESGAARWLEKVKPKIYKDVAVPYNLAKAALGKAEQDGAIMLGSVGVFTLQKLRSLAGQVKSNKQAEDAWRYMLERSHRLPSKNEFALLRDKLGDKVKKDLHAISVKRAYVDLAPLSSDIAAYTKYFYLLKGLETQAAIDRERGSLSALSKRLREAELLLGFDKQEEVAALRDSLLYIDRSIANFANDRYQSKQAEAVAVVCSLERQAGR